MRSIESIETILIEKDLQSSSVVQNILHRNHSAKIKLIASAEQALSEYRSSLSETRKEILLVRSFPGRFLSSCPGSDGMVCCNYAVINLGFGCLFDCHYCYLQQFLNTPVQTLYANIDALFAELDFKLRNQKTRFRIGTGEYTDSLALEPLTGLSAILVEYFARARNATLELKTKSSHVDELLELDHGGHTVVAWSVNPPRIIEAIEPGTASLEERLQAAEKAIQAGYPVALHLDPVIYYPDWEEEYHCLLDQIFALIPPGRVSWISLGSFRYAPGLKEKIQARFPEDALTRAEMVQANDGKYRYFKTIRQAMYVSIRKKIQSIDPALFSYLCMETRSTWKNTVGFIPDSKKNLDALFEERRLGMLARPAGLPARQR